MHPYYLCLMQHQAGKDSGVDGSTEAALDVLGTDLTITAFATALGHYRRANGA
jgi:hypothetical protein